MSDNINSSGSNVVAAQAEAVPGSAAEMTSSALARRRMLLASLGKGSAVVAAAAVPMKSMAGIGTLAVTSTDGRRCTISGTMSAVHSQETVTATCGGYSPGYYKMISHWPNYNASTNVHGRNVVTGTSTYFKDTTTFSSLFGGGLTSGLLSIMNNNASSDEFHWICALLNGTAGSIAVNFPYTNKQVIDLYKAGGGTRADALTFFKNYMEKL